MVFTNRIFLAALGMLAAVGMAAAAETRVAYRISAGDTVEIGIASIPERTQRVMVQMDGTIALPEVGMVSVGGLTPAELQTRMETILTTKIFH
ncbi:MAG: sugar ABC transporter substrate-binding protein, partial [Mesorhizobium sp.]